MNEQQPLDLSALDPMREPERWQAFVDVTMLRVDAVLAERSGDPLRLIASWSRPLMLACVLVVAVLIPVEVILENRETGAEQIQTLVRLSTQSALGEEVPTGAELSQTLDLDLP